MTSKHIKDIQIGEKLKLNLNYVVSRKQFETNTQPVNIVEVECCRVDSTTSFEGRKAFKTKDGEIHYPKEFQYDYKGYFFKHEDEITLWIY